MKATPLFAAIITLMGLILRVFLSWSEPEQMVWIRKRGPLASEHVQEIDLIDG